MDFLRNKRGWLQGKVVWIFTLDGKTSGTAKEARLYRKAVVPLSLLRDHLKGDRENSSNFSINSYQNFQKISRNKNTKNVFSQKQHGLVLGQGSLGICLRWQNFKDGKGGKTILKVQTIFRLSRHISYQVTGYIIFCIIGGIQFIGI